MLFTPGNRIPHPGILNFPHSDKVVHLILFFILGYIMLFETWAIKFSIKNSQIATLAIIGVSFGGFTEVVQQYYAYQRQGSIFDFFADITGIGLAYAIFFAFRKTISRFYRPTF